MLAEALRLSNRIQGQPTRPIPLLAWNKWLYEIIRIPSWFLFSPILNFQYFFMLKPHIISIQIYHLFLIISDNLVQILALYKSYKQWKRFSIFSLILTCQYWPNFSTGFCQYCCATWDIEEIILGEPLPVLILPSSSLPNLKWFK